MIEPQRGEVGEQVRGQQLHERRRVGAEVVRPGRVEVGVAGGAHVDHRRDVELAERLVQRVPVAVGQRRPVPVAARGVGVEVGAHEPHLLDAAPELVNRRLDRGARGLGKLAHRGEVVRVQVAHPPDQLVAVLGPEPAGVDVADVVAHPRRPRREQGEVGAPLALEPQLGALEAGPDLVVADGRRCPWRRRARDRRPARPSAPPGTPRAAGERWCSAHGSR